MAECFFQSIGCGKEKYLTFFSVMGLCPKWFYVHMIIFTRVPPSVGGQNVSPKHPQNKTISDINPHDKKHNLDIYKVSNVPK